MAKPKTATRAFEFLKINERPPKPRSCGVTEFAALTTPRWVNGIYKTSWKRWEPMWMSSSLREAPSA